MSLIEMLVKPLSNATPATVLSEGIACIVLRGKLIGVTDHVRLARFLSGGRATSLEMSLNVRMRAGVKD
ncbi:MAG: hypothetical protein M1820_007797 [Bogoriella megaspora]|nr:MAG: hypothetical protein M1820_007797 [Bogoriella megaspora]